MNLADGVDARSIRIDILNPFNGYADEIIYFHQFRPRIVAEHEKVASIANIDRNIPIDISIKVVTAVSDHGERILASCPFCPTPAIHVTPDAILVEFHDTNVIGIHNQVTGSIDIDVRAVDIPISAVFPSAHSKLDVAALTTARGESNRTDVVSAAIKNTIGPGTGSDHNCVV